MSWHCLGPSWQWIKETRCSFLLWIWGFVLLWITAEIPQIIYLCIISIELATAAISCDILTPFYIQWCHPELFLRFFWKLLVLKEVPYLKRSLILGFDLGMCWMWRRDWICNKYPYSEWSHYFSKLGTRWGFLFCHMLRLWQPLLPSPVSSLSRTTICIGLLLFRFSYTVSQAQFRQWSGLL